VLLWAWLTSLSGFCWGVAFFSFISCLRFSILIVMNEPEKKVPVNVKMKEGGLA
jgi:cytochrome c oxidase subunit IV